MLIFLSRITKILLIPTESVIAEDEVLNHLEEKSGNRLSRPVRNQTEAVEVKFGMMVLSLYLVCYSYVFLVPKLNG